MSSTRKLSKDSDYFEERKSFKNKLLIKEKAAKTQKKALNSTQVTDATSPPSGRKLQPKRRVFLKPLKYVSFVEGEKLVQVIEYVPKKGINEAKQDNPRSVCSCAVF